MHGHDAAVSCCADLLTRVPHMILARCDANAMHDHFGCDSGFKRKSPQLVADARAGAPRIARISFGI